MTLRDSRPQAPNSSRGRGRRRRFIRPQDERRMAKSRPAKKPEKQLDLPAPALSTTTRVLPMQLKPGDRMTDSTGEWEVVEQPFTTARPARASSSRPSKTKLDWCARAAHDRTRARRTASAT